LILSTEQHECMTPSFAVKQETMFSVCS
jgi:hypothetical protein